MNSEVDVNILINHYHKKLSTLVNQNILKKKVEFKIMEEP